MIPILFDKTETAFTSNGLGRLSDAISCIATEERNGAFELAMEYPEGGIHANELETDRIIYAKPAAYMTEQPFRIYKLTKPLNKRFKVMARHISYDLAYVSIMPFGSVGSASQALRGMFNNAENAGNFTLGTVTVSTSGTFTVEEPASFRNLMGGKDGSILDVFGGEILWDGFTVNLYENRGTDRGLTLRYGKNISDISQEKDIDYTVTGITPFFKTSNDHVLTLPEKSVYKQGVSYSTPTRTRVLDCASYIDEDAIREAHPEETEVQIETRLIAGMRSAAQAYANANLSGVPDSSISVSFVDLGSTEEYKDQKALFTQAGLCDTVRVYYERLGIETTAKIIKTEYDVLLDRFEKLTVGKPKSKLSSNLNNIAKSVNDAAAAADAKITAVKKTTELDMDKAMEEAEQHADEVAAEVANQAAADLQAAIDNAGDMIRNVYGGYVHMNRGEDGRIYEIVISDRADYKSNTAKVWRWNLNGLAYSNTGYDGSFSTAAITANGTILGDFIAANSISAAALRAGIIDAGKIATGAVTTEKIAAGAITANKIAAGAITADMINAGDLQVNGKSLAGERTWGNLSVDPQWSGITVFIDGVNYPYMFSGTIVIKTEKSKKASGLRQLAYGLPGAHYDGAEGVLVNMHNGSPHTGFHIDSSGRLWVDGDIGTDNGARTYVGTISYSKA